MYSVRKKIALIYLIQKNISCYSRVFHPITSGWDHQWKKNVENDFLMIVSCSVQFTLMFNVTLRRTRFTRLFIALLSVVFNWFGNVSEHKIRKCSIYILIWSTNEIWNVRIIYSRIWGVRSMPGPKRLPRLRWTTRVCGIGFSITLMLGQSSSYTPDPNYSSTKIVVRP